MRELKECAFSTHSRCYRPSPKRPSRAGSSRTERYRIADAELNRSVSLPFIGPGPRSRPANAQIGISDDLSIAISSERAIARYLTFTLASLKRMRGTGRNQAEESELRTSTVFTFSEEKYQDFPTLIGIEGS